MTATLGSFPVFRAFDDNGAPLVGGFLHSYAAGTLTPLATYTDQGGGTQNTNPVQLDSTGSANVWFGSAAYKLVLKTSTGSTLWTVDQYQPDSGATTLRSDLASTASTALGDGLVGVKRGTVARTQHGVNAETTTALDYGADPTGASDTYAAITAAQTAGVVVLRFTPGTYKISTNTAITMGVVMDIGAKFSIDTGKTLVISGVLTAPSDTIFTGLGAASGPRTIDANWYGMVNDGDYSLGTGTDNSPALLKAIAACGTGGGYSIDLPSGIFLCESSIVVPSGITIRGKGMWSTLLCTKISFTGWLVDIVGGASGYPTRITGIGLIGLGGVYGYSGVRVNKNGTFIDDIWVNGFATGVYIKHTDVFLSNFAIEINTLGIEVDSDAVNISEGTLYDNQTGLFVDNIATTEYIPIVISGVRAVNNGQVGFLIGPSRNVKISNCASSSSTNHSVAGLKIDGSTNIQVTNWGSNQSGTASAPGIWVTGSSNVELTNCTSSGFQDGLKIEGLGENIKVIGGSFDGNARHGINALGWSGPSLVINGASASYNGTAGSATDCGITVALISANQRLLISSCVATQVGGGYQDYGILVANNVSSTNYGRVTDCIAFSNAVTNYSVTGTYLANVTNAGII